MAAVVFVAEVNPEKGIEEATIPEPDIVPAQTKLPFELVTVHPVEPPPPPMRISPVPVLFRFKAPVPLASMERATAASPPVAAKVTPFPVAALARVISLTAEAAEVNLRNSLPLVSRISAPVSFKSPERAVVAAVIVTRSEAKAIVGSVAPASKVQVIPAPAPNVVVPISVVSKLRV